MHALQYITNIFVFTQNKPYQSPSSFLLSIPLQIYSCLVLQHNFESYYNMELVVHTEMCCNLGQGMDHSCRQVSCLRHHNNMDNHPTMTNHPEIYNSQ